jgi:hypothetical protein
MRGELFLTFGRGRIAILMFTYTLRNVVENFPIPFVSRRMREQALKPK